MGLKLLKRKSVEMKPKLIEAYMKTAETFAGLSTAVRLHVGAIIVKDDRIISIGYNGMPSGWDNNCENKEYMGGDAGGWLSPEEIEHQWPCQEQLLPKEANQWIRYKLTTKPEVLHAETNAIAKLAKSTESGSGATLFVTHAPCLDCAKLVYQSGINSVYYRNTYRSEDGLQFLEKAGVKVERI
jgi:dCMP deaminase